MQNGLCPHSKWIGLFLLLFAGAGFLWTGCGKKGPPSPPQRPLPPVVKDLAYSIHNDIVELSWTIPEAAGRKASPAVAVKVYRARLSLEDRDCEDCPIRYSMAGDIPIPKERSERTRPFNMSYSESVEPGYRYFFKVTLFDEYGIGGRDSNEVQFDHRSN